MKKKSFIDWFEERAISREDLKDNAQLLLLDDFEKIKQPRTYDQFAEDIKLLEDLSNEEKSLLELIQKFSPSENQTNKMWSAFVSFLTSNNLLKNNSTFRKKLPSFQNAKRVKRKRKPKHFLIFIVFFKKKFFRIQIFKNPPLFFDVMNPYFVILYFFLNSNITSNLRWFPQKKQDEVKIIKQKTK